MICQDILNIQGLESLNLVAGSAGLNRRIRWIYFADSMRVLGEKNLSDPEKFGEWIQGGELMVITSEIILKNWDFMRNLIYNSEQKKASAVIIQTGFITEQMKTFSDKHEIPLFELSWELRLIDLSQIVCKAILDEENNNDSLDRLFSNIIFGNYDTAADAIKLAQYHNFDLSSKCTAAVIDIADFSKYISKNNLSEGQIQKIMHELRYIIRQCFNSYGIQKIMIMSQSNCVNILFPSEKFLDENIRECFKLIAEKFYSYSKLNICAGVGTGYSYVSKLKESLFEAEKALKLALYNKDSIMFYKDMGILKLFTHIDNEEYLVTYYKEIIGKLEEADRLVRSSLCKTLEVYLDCNCVSADASEMLYIHRNTLRYRLNKIEEILGISLENKKSLVTLYNAFTIRKFIEAAKG